MAAASNVNNSDQDRTALDVLAEVASSKTPISMTCTGGEDAEAPELARDTNKSSDQVNEEDAQLLDLFPDDDDDMASEGEAKIKRADKERTFYDKLTSYGFTKRDGLEPDNLRDTIWDELDRVESTLATEVSSNKQMLRTLRRIASRWLTIQEQAEMEGADTQVSVIELAEAVSDAVGLEQTPLVDCLLTPVNDDSDYVAQDTVASVVVAAYAFYLELFDLLKDYGEDAGEAVWEDDEMSEDEEGEVVWDDAEKNDDANRESSDEASTKTETGGQSNKRKRGRTETHEDRAIKRTGTSQSTQEEDSEMTDSASPSTGSTNTGEPKHFHAWTKEEDNYILEQMISLGYDQKKEADRFITLPKIVKILNDEFVGKPYTEPHTGKQYVHEDRTSSSVKQHFPKLFREAKQRLDDLTDFDHVAAPEGGWTLPAYEAAVRARDEKWAEARGLVTVLTEDEMKVKKDQELKAAFNASMAAAVGVDSKTAPTSTNTEANSTPATKTKKATTSTSPKKKAKAKTPPTNAPAASATRTKIATAAPKKLAVRPSSKPGSTAPPSTQSPFQAIQWTPVNKQAVSTQTL